MYESTNLAYICTAASTIPFKANDGEWKVVIY